MTAFTLDSVRQYKELGVFTQSGGIEVARTPERMEELKRRIASSKSWGIESRAADPGRGQGDWSRSSTSRSSSAASTRPGVGVVDSLRAGTLMREAAQALGALTIVAGDRGHRASTSSDGRVRRVRTDAGDIEADVVVIACGVWSPRIARDGRRLDPAHARPSTR